MLIQTWKAVKSGAWVTTLGRSTPAPPKSDSGFLQKQHAPYELDSGELPSGRMRDPNRYQ